METNKVSVARAGKVIGLFSIQEIRQGMAAQTVLASDYWYDSTARQWLRFSDKFPQVESQTVPPPIPQKTNYGAGDESGEWKTPPAVEHGDDQPATKAQKRVLLECGLELPPDLRKNQASEWIDKLPYVNYPLAESGSSARYGLDDWMNCPPRELRTNETKAASEKQINLIRGFELDPPSDLTMREASRWINILLKSDGARNRESEIRERWIRATNFLKGVRAHRTAGNSQRLTSEIMSAVVHSVYSENKGLFAEKEVKNKYGGVNPEFIKASALADALMARLARDYPGCVDGNAPAPRARPAPAPAPSIPAATGKGCAVLLLPPLFALAWMASA